MIFLLQWRDMSVSCRVPCPGSGFRGDFALDAIVADEIAPTTPPPAAPAEAISCA